MYIYGWQATGKCKEHPHRECFFHWVPCLHQIEMFLELDEEVPKEYLDRGISVSAPDEDEDLTSNIY